jgi:hypothetical protein
VHRPIRDTGAMADPCTHTDQIQEVAPSGNGCVECLEIGAQWLHLRRCTGCGHIGCCDSSPNRHATAHFREAAHPVIQSFEPGEDWYWCFIDEIAFERQGDTASPSHT